MGIYDRHYIRDTPPPRGGAGGMHPPMWSVTTWLIIICVAVYVIDGFLPRRDVLTGRVAPADRAELFPGALEVAPVDMMVRFVNPLPDGRVVVEEKPAGYVSFKFTYITHDGREISEEKIARPLIERVALERNDPPTVVAFAEVIPSMPLLQSWLHFSTQRGFLGFEWWRFIGFQFLHGNFSHLLFNMIALFFFGPMVEQYLGSKRYLAFYLLCGICGALMYLALNLAGYILTQVANEPVTIPLLLFNDTSTPLVGASAGIFGILMAGAYMAPNAVVLLFFILPMRLKTLAYVLVGLAIFTLVRGGPNAGGEAGHLGGAIAGFYLIRRPHHLHGFFDILGRADPTSHHYRHRHGRAKRARIKSAGPGSGREHEIDRILDKINAEGIHSLTESEKRSLRDASNRS